MIEMIMRALGGPWRVHRLCRARSRALRVVARLLWRRYMRAYGGFVGVTAEFASPPVLPHGPFGLFVSGGARVGSGCVIFQHVTIGSNTIGGSKGTGAPTIGDNCYIGAGAAIIGGVTVGDDVRIGANAVVVKDVEDGTVVVGPPSRHISRPGLSNDFDPFDADRG